MPALQTQHYEKYFLPGYQLKIPFTAYSDVADEIIKLEWTSKNGVQMMNIAPTEVQLVSKEYIQHTLYFTLSLPEMISDNDLFTFKARSVKTNKLFLINGNRDFKTGLVSRTASNRLHLVISDVTGNLSVKSVFQK